MSNELFSSGPWTGFYNYKPGNKHRMDLHLTFTNGRITGDGIDDVGHFVVVGHYNEAERECDWTKTYPGSHDVAYRGFREGKGIWGSWEIGAGLWGHDGFHIWPKGLKKGEGQSATVGETAPVEVIGKDQELTPTLFPTADQDARFGSCICQNKNFWVGPYLS